MGGPFREREERHARPGEPCARECAELEHPRALRRRPSAHSESHPSPRLGGAARPTSNNGTFVMRRRTIWALGFLGVLVLLLASGVALILSIDLRPWIEAYLSQTLDRRLTIGSLHIGWGDPLTVELRDFRIANPSWGSSLDLLRIDSASAQIDVLSLFGGPLRFEKLELVNPVIVLERNAAGTGNWQMGRATAMPSHPAPPRTSTYAANRVKIPTLIDLALRGGKVSLRTSSGQGLRIELQDFKLRAGGVDRPLTITLVGAYNDQQGKLTAEGEAFDLLRQPMHPYGITFSIANPATSIDFKGTVLDPLAFDGVKASLNIQAQRLADLPKIFGVESGANFPIRFAVRLTRECSHRKLFDAQGQLASSSFAGTLALEEAGRGQTDDVNLDLGFPRLDLDTILADARKAGTARADWSTVVLHLEEKRGTNIAWR